MMTNVRPEARMAASIARICNLEDKKKRLGKGRPVSVGVGKKVTIYLPNKSLDLLDQISRDWSGSRSEIIQEAIARYAADLDAVIREGEQHG